MNKVMLIGNLTRDPELRTTPSGVQVCTFSLAITRKFSSQGAEKQTDYFNVVTWRQLADLCNRYLAKGRKVAVSGYLTSRSYEDKTGVKRNITEIVAEDVEFLTPKDSAPRDYSPSDNLPQPPPAYDQNDSYADTQGFTELDDATLPF